MSLEKAIDITELPQYKNAKASYASGIWKVINWQEAEKRFLSGVEDLKL